MDKPYTDRKGQYLVYIDTYFQLHGKPPSEAEMAAYFGVAPPTVHQMVVQLEARGLIERTPGVGRSIRVLVHPQQELTPGLTADAKYPELASWVTSQGWVELGRNMRGGAAACALCEAGVAWESGQHRYNNLEELLRGLNDGIARWNEENT